MIATSLDIMDSDDNYNNTIEGATEGGIVFYNPDIQDVGSTTGNLVYSNLITDSENGIRATRSQNNIAKNNTFSEIESNEFRLLGDSTLKIIGQEFDNTLISGDDEVAAGNLVEIVNSGTIEVTEGEIDNDDEESEGESHNTDNEPYRRTLSDGDRITVNSS
jgi:parallel beta-helix repeat protein